MQNVMAARAGLDKVIKELLQLLLLICIPHFWALVCIADAACALADKF